MPISQVLHIIWVLQDFPENQFLSLFLFNGFYCYFPCLEKLTRQPMHLPYDEVQDRMGIHWKKSPILWKKQGNQFPRHSPFDGFCYAMGNLMGMGFPNSHLMKYTIGWESNGKKHPYCGKIMSTNFAGSPHAMGFPGDYGKPISQTFPIRWVQLSFLMLWEINEKIHAFPV